jgi:hypothetical protein
MIKWEYKDVALYRKMTVEEMNVYGLGGWELCLHVAGIWTFERPLQETKQEP